MENPYIYVVVALGAVALASFAIYDSERLRESRTALGVILLASLILPISSVIGGIRELDFSFEAEYDGEQIVEERLEEAFCLGIAEAVREEFSIKKDNISVTAQGFDAESMRADSLLVLLSGRAAFGNIGAISDFVSELGVGECTVEVRLG